MNHEDSRNEEPTRGRAVLALTGACAFWAASFLLTKALAEGAELAAPHASTWFVSGFLVATRFVVAAACLYWLDRQTPTRSELVQGIFLGVSTGIGMLLQTDGLAYTAASTSAFFTQGYVFMLPVVATVRTRRSPPGRVLVCALLVFMGLAVLARFDPRSVSLGRGETETLAAAACFTVQILVVGAPRYLANRPAQVTTIMFFVIFAVMLPITLATARGASDFAAPLASKPAWAYFSLVVIFPTLGSFLLMNRFQRYIPASDAGIIYATEPVFASALALFLPAQLSRLSGISYPNETVDVRLILGGGLVVGANVLLALLERSRRGASETCSSV